MACLALPLPCLSFLLLLCLSPSPTWLVAQGRVDKARKVIVWLRDSPLVEVGLDRLSMTQDHEQLGFKGLFKDRTVHWVILIILGMGLANQLCRINMVLTYTDYLNRGGRLYPLWPGTG